MKEAPGEFLARKIASPPEVVFFILNSRWPALFDDKALAKDSRLVTMSG